MDSNINREDVGLKLEIEDIIKQVFVIQLGLMNYLVHLNIIVIYPRNLNENINS